MYGIMLDIESFSLELQNCSEHLRTSLDVFGSPRKTSDMFVSSSEKWYSPIKNLMPLTWKKLAGIENHEHLKYFENDYCVMTNHIREQDIRANHKTIIIIAVYSLD